MPQAWTMRTSSSFSNASMSACGTAEPPQITRRSEDRSPPLARTCWSSPFQMVGTAPASVGRSASISATSGAGWRNRSGMIIEAPAITAA